MHHFLAAVHLPDTVEKIYFGAFEGCSSLMSINIPPKLSYAGRHILADTKVNKLVFTEIGCGYDTDPAYFQCHETFADMKYLREVSLQQSLKSIGNNAFANCIQSYIFSECYSLEKITIPASVEEIGERYMNTFAELAGSAFFCEKKSWDILTNQ